MSCLHNVAPPFRKRVCCMPRTEIAYRGFSRSRGICLLHVPALCATLDLHFLQRKQAVRRLPTPAFGCAASRHDSTRIEPSGAPPMQCMLYMSQLPPGVRITVVHADRPAVLQRVLFAYAVHDLWGPAAMERVRSCPTQPKRDDGSHHAMYKVPGMLRVLQAQILL